MTAPAGRRAAHKQATRAALTTAAKRLFTERGFEQTTVRDIAKAAAVTERTFYRYFDGKEGLIAEVYLTWLDRLHDAILARPASEPPLAAVQRAMADIARHAAAAQEPAPAWLFSEGVPMRTLRRFEPRPLLRLEASISTAMLTRIRAGRVRDRAAGSPESAAPGGPEPAAGGGPEPAAGGGPEPTAPGGSDDEFAARVLGRVAVAALRSAVIQYRELRATGAAGAHNAGQLLDRAFAIIKDQASARDQAPEAGTGR